MRSRVLIISILLAAVMVVAPTVSAQSEAAETAETAVVVAKPKPPTKAERLWAKGLRRWSNRITRAANTVTYALSTVETLQVIANGDRSLLHEPIEALRGCTGFLKTSAGPPPSARSRAVQRLFKRSCRTFEQAIRIIERGLDTRNPDTVYAGVVGLDVGREQGLTAVDAMGDLFGR